MEFVKQRNEQSEDLTIDGFLGKAPVRIFLDPGSQVPASVSRRLVTEWRLHPNSCEPALFQGYVSHSVSNTCN